MKIRSPKDRFDLIINKSDRVLEVGGGHNPHPRANIVVDKFVDNNYHRNGDIKILKHQQFISAAGESLPFKDKEFDYVICCQVLEHVEDPLKFLTEQFRVAKKGYIETPSLIGEHLFPKESHKWILHDYKNVLYLVDKSSLNFSCRYDLGEFFQDFLPKKSLGYKILQRTHPNIETIRIEWEEDFAFIVNPSNTEILKYFSDKWRIEWSEEFFPKTTILSELVSSTKAFTKIFRSVMKSRLAPGRR
jgi:SAM-dependent methyltransferase